MDRDDGAIRFIASFFTPTNEATPEPVENLFIANVSTMDPWADAIMQQIH